MKQQQPLMGFLFALIAAIAWGTLPIALKQVLALMNSQTVAWYRFIVAFLALLLLLSYRKKLPTLKMLMSRAGYIVLIAISGLAGHFFLFNTSLHYVDPEVVQIFIHLSSFVMLLCGVIFFKERLGLHQKIGLIILIIGFGLFFNDRFALFATLNKYSLGVVISISAALLSVVYGLSQKLLLKRFSSPQILLMIYFGCTLVFTPFVELKQIQLLTPFAWICFIYCCLNTLFGYGAYAEALNRWDVSKVSVIITLVPLFTILFSHIAHYVIPVYFDEPELNSLSYIGAFVVTFGAMFSAIGHKFLPQK